MSTSLTVAAQKAQRLARAEYLEQLTFRTSGAIAAAQENANIILANDPIFDGVFAYDEFAECVVKLKPIACDEFLRDSQNETGDYMPEDTTRVLHMLGQMTAAKFTPQQVEAAIAVVARRNRIHPVRDYLRALKWDGVERLSSWMTTYLGARDNPYTRAVARITLIAAVARAMVPGCKCDHMVALEGRQGTFKSTAIKTLCPNPDWFIEFSASLDTKDGPMHLRRKWILEMDELASMSKAHAGQVKAFLSRCIDRYRAPYDRAARDYKRQSVLFGSTNLDEYLVDSTGNRRVFPVACGTIDIAGLASMRDQLWAEAVAAFTAGEAWHITDKKVLAMAEQEQADRKESDVWLPIVSAWLETDEAKDLVKSQGGLTTLDVLARAVRLDPAAMNRGTKERASGMLKDLGWERGRQIGSGAKRGERLYVAPKPKPEATHIPWSVKPFKKPDAWMLPTYRIRPA